MNDGYNNNIVVVCVIVFVVGVDVLTLISGHKSQMIDVLLRINGFETDSLPVSLSRFSPKIGSPVRQRSRGLLPNVNNVPSDYARAVSSAIARLITQGFSWTPPPNAPTPKLRSVAGRA